MQNIRSFYPTQLKWDANLNWMNKMQVNKPYCNKINAIPKWIEAN